MFENDPLVKSLMKNKKIYLVTWAKQRGLDCTGNKVDLSRRLALDEYERFSKNWQTISNKKG